MGTRSLFIAGVVLALLVSNADEAEAQLRADRATLNPMAGQGVPPSGIPVMEFPVAVQASVRKLILVHPNHSSFKIGFWWIISWKDPTAVDTMMAEYTSCQFYCTSAPGFQNDAGQPACCDGVFIPQAEATSVNGYDNQINPFTYFVIPFFDEEGTITYTSYVQADFAVAFSYAAYPWDKHNLCLDIQTSFRPLLDNALVAFGWPYDSQGVVVEANVGTLVDSQRLDLGGPGAYRPALEGINLAEWQVGRTWMDILEFSTWTSTKTAIIQSGFVKQGVGVVSMNDTTPGVRMCIEAYRQSRPFYTVALVLPVVLIVLFSFGMFSLPKSSLKARVEMLMSLFLTLILLQYVMYGILPSSFQLTLPQKLLLVSYAYTFAMMAIALLSHVILGHREQRKKSAQRAAAKANFSTWLAKLHMGRPPARPSKSSKGQEPGSDRQQHHSDQITPSTAEASKATTLPSRGPEEDTLQVWARAEIEGRIEGHCSTFRMWAMRMRNKLKLVRAFAGLEEGAAYVDQRVQTFEWYARLFLAVTFVAGVSTLCGLTASASERESKYHTLPGR